MKSKNWQTWYRTAFAHKMESDAYLVHEIGVTLQHPWQQLPDAGAPGPAGQDRPGPERAAGQRGMTGQAPPFAARRTPVASLPASGAQRGETPGKHRSRTRAALPETVCNFKLTMTPLRFFPRGAQSGPLRTVCCCRVRAKTPRFRPNQDHTALETAPYVELRAVSASNYPRTDRESRLKAMETRRVPRLEAIGGCGSSDVPSAKDVGRDLKRDVDGSSWKLRGPCGPGTRPAANAGYCNFPISKSGPRR